jgi:hypothetical protein
MSLIKASNRSCSAILIPRAVRQRCDPEIAITNKQACPYQLADKADRFVSVGGQRFDVDRGEVSTGVLSPKPLARKRGTLTRGCGPVARWARHRSFASSFRAGINAAHRGASPENEIAFKARGLTGLRRAAPVGKATVAAMPGDGALWARLS